MLTWCFFVLFVFPEELAKTQKLIAYLVFWLRKVLRVSQHIYRVDFVAQGDE